MSSLASTILPVPSCAASQAPSTASPTGSQPVCDTPLELTIPLPRSRTSSEEIYADEEPIESEVCVEQPLAENMEDVPPEGDLFLGATDRSNESLEPPAIAAVSPVSLGQLTSLIALEKDYIFRANNLRERLKNLRLSCGLNRRLLHISASAYRSMVAHFKTADQMRFLEFYDAGQGITETTSFGANTFGASHTDANDTGTGLASGSPNWMEMLPPVHQENILRFLNRIRSETDYVAECLSRLSSTKLVAFTSHYQSGNILDSVLPGRSNMKGQRLGKDPGVTPRDLWPRELGQDDPIFILLHGVFDDSLGPGSWEYHQRIEVWATACARVMVGGRRGSDEIVTTTLDAFASLQEWTMKPRLESYLTQVLRKGAFLLESPTNQAMNFEESVETRNAKAAVSASNFFESSVQGLFTLLADNLPQTIPLDLRNLMRSMLGKIENSKIRIRAEIFLVSKWFFGTFISNLLVYPESHGMLMTHHVGDTARKVILKELVVRMQKQVFDVSSPWKYSLVSSESQALIEKIFAVFKPSQPKIPGLESQPPVRASEKPEPTAFLLLSPRDVVSLIKTLHPQSPSSPASAEPLYSGNTSKASSVAESSTLTSSSTNYGSGVPSSMAPSISGTSMTSTTVLSEAPLQESSSHSHEDVNSIPNSTAQGTSKIQKEAEGEIVTQLLETCQLICGIIEDEPSVNTAFHCCDWASISVLGSGNGLSVNLSDCQEEVQEANSNDGNQEDFKTAGSQAYRELENAISRSMNYQNSSLDLGYHLHAMDNGRGSENECLGALNHLFRSAMASCRSSFDFQGAHLWWTSLQTLRGITIKDCSGEAFHSMLQIVVRRKQSVIDLNARMTRKYENQLCSLERLERRQTIALDAMEGQRKALRLKMWYVCDVKHSATYEDALGVTRALRAMTDCKRSKQSSGITSWARQRLRTPLSQDKSVAHVLEALAAPRDCGGPAKLADQQVELTSRWLTRNSIENFCKGEERIHRFCHEIQRCVNKLTGVNMLESPVLWSSNLFKHEKSIFEGNCSNATSVHRGEGHMSARHNRWSNSMAQAPPSPISPINPPAPFYGPSLHSPKTMNDFWNASKPAPTFNEPIGVQGPWNSSAATDPAPWLRSNPYGSSLAVPPLSPLQSSRNTTAAPHNFDSDDHSEARRAFANKVKEAITSLLLSDLGYPLWNQGSETDTWINKPDLNRDMDDQTSPRVLQPQSEPEVLESSPASGNALSDSTITVRLHEESESRSAAPGGHLKKAAVGENAQSCVHGVSNRSPDPETTFTEPSFPFSDAYASILERLSSSHDPYTKLDLLFELEMLAFSSLDDLQRSQLRAQSTSANLQNTSPSSNTLGARGINVPRTKATSLEEVIANCTERRAGTLKFNTAYSSPQSAPSLQTIFQPPEDHPTGTDEIVEALLSVFRDDALRPATLYRDLQLIAAHIPSSILDRTAKGKAFWDAGLAALALKEERISAMITRATRITTYHISATKDDTQTFTSAYSPDLVNTTLADAAHLWTIAAKEGSPIAARELALFYLTHPEIVPRVTMPLSKAKDVFGTVASNEKGVDTKGLNPLTFAVVFHWMEVAASGGDKDATDFLRGTGDLSGVR